MGYIVADAVARTRRYFGIYHSTEWEDFLVDAGLDLLEADLPPTIPAMICDETIVVRRSLHRALRPRYMWEEIGHWVLHEGDRRWWRSRPQGDITVSRCERQAKEFADTFPIWDE